MEELNIKKTTRLLIRDRFLVFQKKSQFFEEVLKKCQQVFQPNDFQFFLKFVLPKKTPSNTSRSFRTQKYLSQNKSGIADLNMTNSFQFQGYLQSSQFDEKYSIPKLSTLETKLPKPVTTPLPKPNSRRYQLKKIIQSNRSHSSDLGISSFSDELLKKRKMFERNNRAKKASQFKRDTICFMMKNRGKKQEIKVKPIQLKDVSFLDLC